MSIENGKRIEFIDAQPQPRSNKRKSGFRDIINGNILNKENVTAQIPYILFLAFLAIFYIGNRYKYEKLIRNGQTLQVEVKNLRAESITTASQLMFISKQSQVSRLVNEKGLGLEESVTPPKKIKSK
ncbi:MAG TPA: FtsL-like putative cell division protein [Tenuifilaceae bacterium]|nr:FtsL-like putative cell division protein [Tenuifilaceae bacterium]